MTNDDLSHMLHALRLGGWGLGRTWPNPSVGAVVVKDGLVTGVGVTARGGRPHAETEALAQAGARAKDATLYVTLEPCAHFGKTPPCAQAIVASGITRVVAAATDPNPLTAGKGFAQLRAAGIAVEQGVCETEALRSHEGFFSVLARKRPFVTLKLATSLDGKIALMNGQSQWITGEESRRKAHGLRATHDAVLTGIGTVLADDPALTCRLPGREADSPQRVVVDSALRIEAKARILPAWIFTAAGNAEKKKALEDAGSLVFETEGDNGRVSLPALLAKLAELGVTRLLVEAGNGIASAFMRQELIDRIYWFRAPFVIGDKGIPALAGDNAESLAALPRVKRISVEQMGVDMLEIYERSS